MNQVRAGELWQRCWSALGEAASAQQEHQASSDPVHRFLELLVAAISSGRAHLSGGDGDRPKQATAWGWREVEVGTGGYARTDLQPRGENIGWIDGGEIYLQSSLEGKTSAGLTVGKSTFRLTPPMPWSSGWPGTEATSFPLPCPL